MKFLCFLILVLCVQITYGQEVKAGATIVNNLNDMGATQVDYATAVQIVICISASLLDYRVDGTDKHLTAPTQYDINDKFQIDVK